MHGADNEVLHLGLYQLRDVSKPSTTIPGLSVQELYMDRRQAELVCQLLQSSIQHIQSRHYSKLKFEELYRHGYYLVQHNFGWLLHHKLEEVINEYITSKVQSKVLAHLDRSFLSAITSEWDSYQTSMVIISDMLMYMDRVYLSQQGLDNIYTLGLKLFRDQVVCYDTIQEFLQNMLLSLVAKERQGSLVDRPLFRKTTKLLVEMGNKSRSIYQEIFEDPFLEQSAIFYRMESQKLLEKDNASYYLFQAKKRLFEEIERSEECYDETTSSQIVKVVEDELITANMKAVIEMSSGVVFMIQNGATQDLACFYMLLSRVPNGLKILFEYIGSYLLDEGVVLMTGEESNNNPQIYIQNLLDLKDNIDFFVMNCFSNDYICKQKIAFAFEQILNINKRSPEFLSAFIDEKLKKAVRGMTDDDKTILLDKTMVLFRFLQDKDLFLQYYKQDLAKRLIFSKIINEENEKCVINKFKIECGLHYTSTLEGMFQDIGSSTILTEEFRKYVANSQNLTQGIIISMRVLKSFNWLPVTQNNPSCNLPDGPLAAFEAFTKFYMSLHSGRKLKLLPQLGSAELEVGFLRPEVKNENKVFLKEVRCYTLQVTTYQMCVLMKFNDNAVWSYEDLLEETNIPPKDLQKTLQSLVAGKPSLKVLNKQPDSPTIESGDFFHLNNEFTSKSNRVKIPHLSSIKYESESERQDTLERLNKSRNFEIDAAIIRVMKVKRIVNHDNLINEVIKSLTQRFTPSKDVIKTRIESLIQREYIERNSEDRNKYNYIT